MTARCIHRMIPLLGLLFVLPGTAVAEGESTAAVRRVRSDASGKLVPEGGLSGKTIYISPGHGYVYDRTYGWHTQRGLIKGQGILEDLNNVDFVGQFLVPVLQAAGAYVVPLREIDPNPQWVIVDNKTFPKSAEDPKQRYGNQLPRCDAASEEGSEEAALVGVNELVCPVPGVTYYQETGGAAGTFTDDLPNQGWETPTVLNGIGGKTIGIPDDQSNPFVGKNGQPRARLMKTVTGKATASAAFIPAVRKSGTYYLYLAYTSDPTRASDVHVTVKHPGGQTHFLVDQRRHGKTWVLLGRFYFEYGQNKERGAVVISNESAAAGQTISLDAVRLGGGPGIIRRDTVEACSKECNVYYSYDWGLRGACLGKCKDHACEVNCEINHVGDLAACQDQCKGPGGAWSEGRSRQRRADECSLYHSLFSGFAAKTTRTSTNDYGADTNNRPMFAEWLNKNRTAGSAAEQAIFLSYHSNSGAGTKVGAGGTVICLDKSSGSKTPSEALALALDAELRADLSAALPVANGLPAWRMRAPMLAKEGHNYGEISQSLLKGLPGVLIESAFHDNPSESAQLLDPRFNQAFARAVYRGVAQYFGVASVIPEAPTAVQALVKNGTVEVGWSAAAGAQGYRVYTSDNGFSFGLATTVAAVSRATSIKLPASQGLLFLRVIAVDAQGGESLPGQTVAVAWKPQAQDKLLLVAGYDRVTGANPTIEARSYQLGLGSMEVTGLTERLWMDRINDGSTMVPLARAIWRSGVPFDSATHQAIKQNGPVPLTGYQVVFWQGGQGIRVPVAAEPGGWQEFRWRTAETAPAFAPPAIDALHHAAQNWVSMVLSGTAIARPPVGDDTQWTQKWQPVLASYFKASHAGDLDTSSLRSSATTTPDSFLAPLADQSLGKRLTLNLTGSLGGLEPGQYTIARPGKLKNAGGQVAVEYYGGKACQQQCHDNQPCLQTCGVHPAAVQGQLDHAKTLLFGFPLEGIRSGDQLIDVVGRSLQYFELATSCTAQKGERCAASGASEGNWGEDGALGGCSLGAGRPAPTGLGILLLTLLGLVGWRRGQGLSARRR